MRNMILAILFAASLFFNCSDNTQGQDSSPDEAGVEAGLDLAVVDSGDSGGDSGDGGGGDGAGDSAADKSDGPALEASTQDGPTGEGKASDVNLHDAWISKYAWSQMPATTSKTGTLYAVWGSGSEDVFAVGDKGTILHHDGRRAASGSWWQVMTSGVSSDLEGIWGSSPLDVFAAGASGSIVWYDGAGWTVETSGETKAFRALWGSGYSDVYAMGEFGAMVHNGRTARPNTWTAVKPGSGETFLGSWGSSASDIFVVGSNGATLRYDGSAWKKMTSGTTKHLWSVWSSGANNAIAVGEDGTILRYDGSAWKTMASGTNTTLRGVWGSSPSDVFAVGEKGAIHHYDGLAWSWMVSGTSSGLHGVWGSGANDVFAVGDKMTIMHYGPCDCKVGTLCYATGDRDATGCQVCDPAKSTTALSTATGGCTISSVCYKKGDLDSTRCQVCDPAKNTTAWTKVSGGCTINGLCFPKGAPGAAACQQCDPTQSTTAWSATAGSCFISGKCYAKGQKDSTGCMICDPAQSSTAWTSIPNMCLISSKCYKDGAKDVSGCRVCDAAKAPKAWTIVSGSCYIYGKCYNNGFKPSSGCQVCDSAKNNTAWTQLAGWCYIGNTCYLNGVKDSGGCRRCYTSVTTTAWTMLPNYCYIYGKCYAKGAKNTGGCQVCDSAQSTDAWTMVPGYCYIESTCYADGTKNSTGCKKCDVAKSTSAWTPVGCSAYPLQKKKIYFAKGSSTSAMTPASIFSDGTGYTQTPGFGTLYTSYSSYLYGNVREYYPFTREEPRQESRLSYGYPISLTNKHGSIRWYRDVSANKVGVMHLGDKGLTTSLYTTSGSSYSYLYYYFAASLDGKYVATHRPQKGLVVMRTDGTKYSSGKPYMEFDPATAPYYIYTTSVTIAGKYAYMVSRATSSSSSQHTLWYAPLDGSAGIKAVTLPQVGSASPKFIDDEIASSEDGSVIATTAGSNSSNEDLITVNTSTMKAVNVSKSPGTFRERSYYWGYAGSGSQMAVSAKGTYVAYVKYVSSRYNLYVAKADGSGTPYHVTQTANFSYTYHRPYSLKFLDDDNLIFTIYGSSSSYNDIYRFQASTNTLANLTLINSTSKTKPYYPSSTSYFRTYGMWLSPNRKYLYFLAYHRPVSTYYYDIKAVDLSTWKVKDITTGAEVYLSADAFASCQGKGTFFYVAEPQATTYTRHQLFSFNMNTASKPVQLTNLPGSTYNPNYMYIYDVTPSPDCTHVAFRAGYSNYLNLYAGQAMKGKITNGSNVTGVNYVFDYIGVSSDNKQVVYFDGTSSSRYTMKVVPMGTGPCCKPQIIYPKGGTTTTTYWLLYGMD